MATYRHILVALDLQSDSLLVAQRARALATALDATLDMIHVVEPLPAVAPIPPEPIEPSLVTEQTERLELAQQRMSSLARQLAVPEARWRIVDGVIKSEIIRAAVELKVDLIVIGNRERHGLALLFKPTEDAVMHRAPCDVLAVRLSEE